jgi:uncharacterized protein (DUF1330 family)
MVAYLIVELDVHDREGFREYRPVPTFAPYGGRIIGSGGPNRPIETIEGDWQPKGIVLIEFPSKEHAKAWYDSPAYQEPKSIRHRCAHTKAVMIEGREQVATT